MVEKKMGQDATFVVFFSSIFFSCLKRSRSADGNATVAYPMEILPDLNSSETLSKDRLV